MDLSTRFLRLFGLTLITVFVVSCAQPGAGILPTSPSSPSVGPSPAASGPGASSGPVVTLGPGASYDASGMWRFVSTDIHGNGEETFDTNVSQDSNGNLSFLDEEGTLIALERRGTGVIITYRVSFNGDEGGDCDILGQGTVRLDTRTHTITGNVLLRELGCSHDHLKVVVTGTKLS